MEDNGIINAVKRLERAGSEHSRATQKLFAAAAKVAAFIEERVPVGVDLPRGYYTREVTTNSGSARFLCRDIPIPVEGDDENEAHVAYVTRYVDGLGGHVHGDFRTYVPDQDRETVLRFAEDIAGGLLDEIAAWLESRAVEAEKAASSMEKTLG